MKDMKKKEKQKSADTDVSEISRLIKLHEEANSWFTKRQILSVFVNYYTKAQLHLLIPGLSFWAVDEARRHAAKVGVGKPVPQMETITRARLDPSKVDNFLDFISSPNFVQDVGVRNKNAKIACRMWRRWRLQTWLGQLLLQGLWTYTSNTVRKPVSFHLGLRSSVFYRYVSKQNYDSKSEEERK